MPSVLLILLLLLRISFDIAVAYHAYAAFGCLGFNDTLTNL